MSSAEGKNDGEKDGQARSMRLPGKQQQQQQHQPSQRPPQPQPHSPRGRVRRGQSPQQPSLTVLIDRPSLDESINPPNGSAAVAVSRTSGGRSDSLSLALEELRGVRPGPANFFEAHEAVTSAAGVGGGGGGSGVGGRGAGGSTVEAGYRSDEDFLNVRPMAKRSSSLKSKKTPPGTPTQVKKAVRFADAFGLDLANVKHVLDPDTPPEIPPQATWDLQLGDADSSEEEAAAAAAVAAAASAIASDGGDEVDARSRGVLPGSQQIKLTLRPAFSQPGQSAGFGARVMAQKVVLESAAYYPAASEIRGYIRVANLAFEKSVSVRATFDAWRTSLEVPAAYVPDSSSGMTDQFAFTLALPRLTYVPPGFRISFCIAYRVAGQAFWDNNFGENYAFDAATTTAFDAWPRVV